MKTKTTRFKEQPYMSTLDRQTFLRVFSLERLSLTSAFAGLRRDKPALSRRQGNVVDDVGCWCHGRCVGRSGGRQPSPSGETSGRAGLSLLEMMIVMGIFGLLVAGMVAAQLYSLRVYTKVATKLVATAGAEQVMNGLRDQLREANAVYVGNCSSDWTTYADVTNGARQGNAVEIYPTASTNKYLICYLDTTTRTNRLMLYSSSLGTVQQLASYVTNRMVFDAEDLYGNVLTNNRKGRVISMTLQFSQWEYPIGGTNFDSFNYYQLRTSATRRSIN